MWRPASRTRTGLSLVLGVFVGIALLSIPAFLSPSPPTAQSSDTETRSLFEIQALSNVPSTGAQKGTSAESTVSEKLSLGLNLFLILLPASVLSILARRWTRKKLSDYWYY